MKLAIVSGGFDPIHSGHIDNIINAYEKVGPVIVILNSDEWLVRKKGDFFMDWKNRMSICKSIKGVIDVVKAIDNDNTVCESLKELRNRFPLDELVFCKGGDRVSTNTPESKICKDLNIEIMYGIGGDKIYSSRQFLKRWDRSILKENY